MHPCFPRHDASLLHSWQRLLVQLVPCVKGRSPASGLFSPVSLPSLLRRKEAHHPLPTRFGPRGSTSLVALRSRRRGLLDIVRREVRCRFFDFGVGVRYPAVGWRSQRTTYGIGLPPFSIPLVGQN